jgi:hypothetical protein
VTEKRFREDEMARIALIEARAAIGDIVYGYARNIRAGKGADCVELFTEDAIFEVREAPLGSHSAGQARAKLAGHDAILRYLVHNASSQTRVCPMIHNLLIRVDGREASSDCVMTALVSTGQRLFGEYQDRFRYEDRWRFSSRVFTILAEFGPTTASGDKE